MATEDHSLEIAGGADTAIECKLPEEASGRTVLEFKLPGEQRVTPCISAAGKCWKSLSWGPPKAGRV